MSARIPISENAVPNCATCSGANYDPVTEHVAPPVGAGAAADIGPAPARRALESERHSYGLGRGFLRDLGILRPAYGSDLHGAAERDLRGGGAAHSERRTEEGDGPDLMAVLGRHGAYRGCRHRPWHRHGAMAHVGIRARPLHQRALRHPTHRSHSADHPGAGLEFVGKVSILVSV